jgi:OOP family OmpA-OmpF porin
MKSIDMTRLLKLPSLPALLLAALLLASFMAQADEGDWYVAPSIAYTDDDGARKIDDSLAGGQIQVGKEMTDYFALEGLVGYHDIDGFPGQEHLEIGFNAMRKFRPESLFSPYVIGGLGYLRADAGLPDFGGIPTAGTTSSSATATAGLGMQLDLGDSPWSLRAEWRLRHAFDSSGLTDQIGTIGIQYSFGGGGSDRAVPVAVSEPKSVAYSDSDHDGVSDDSDRCPGTVAGARVDLNGCEIQEAIELKNIYFGFDSDVVLPAARRLLDRAASIMSRNPDLQVELAGFADASGNERYNMELSQRRAEAVREYLEQAGVSPANLTINAYGESRSGANAAANRRVELRITNR